VKITADGLDMPPHIQSFCPGGEQEGAINSWATPLTPRTNNMKVVGGNPDDASILLYANGKCQ
jgi:hypothetical protein